MQKESIKESIANFIHNISQIFLAVFAFFKELYMQKTFKYLLIGSLACSSLSAYAETKNKATQTAEESLVSRVLSKDSPYLNNHFQQLNSLNSINRSSNDKVLKETISTKINLPEQSPNIINKLNTVASEAVRKFSQTGIASWYGRQFNGRKTASGEIYNMNALTAAHPTLPLNCYVRVTNEQNGKSVIVKINDRSPFEGNRVLDLSYGAAKQLGMVDSGSAKVKIERVEGPNS